MLGAGSMRGLVVAGCVLAGAAASPCLGAPPAAVSTLLDTRSTATGQAIVLPQRDVHLLVSRFVIRPGASLPEHKHPFQRYGYVLSGALSVTITGPGPGAGQVFHYKAGNFIVEVRDEWHYGTAIGPDPCVLLVIDQVQDDQPATIAKPTGVTPQ
jgi:quercetin dioxygenase-like cupin family protein